MKGCIFESFGIYAIESDIIYCSYPLDMVLVAVSGGARSIGLGMSVVWGVVSLIWVKWSISSTDVFQILKLVSSTDSDVV